MKGGKTGHTIRDIPRKVGIAMKAVILAGGGGTRLRPLSLGRPKALLPVLGRPVLAHLLALLKAHGITEVALALGEQGETIRDWLEGEAPSGLRLTCHMEEEPLGTAGAVGACLSGTEGEEVLVLPGDCLCDLDLTALIRAHREKGAAATLALYRHPTPLEYGLVLVDGEGRVTDFVEKPAWGQVVTDLVNTGIYVLSPAVAEQIPQGKPWDFGHDLFPALLAEGAALYGCPLRGWWRDMGDCKAYLEVCCEALSGKGGLEPGLPQREPGIWSAAPLPREVSLIPPCWIGEGAVIRPGALVGPHVVLERGAVVEERAMVQRSVLLEDSLAGPRSTLYGAVLGRGSAVRRGAVLDEGTALGEHALVEEGATLLEGVCLWPGQTAPAGCRLTQSVTHGSRKGLLSFGEDSVIQGVLGEDMGPEALMALGSALGAEGRLGLACTPTPAGKLLARSAAAGAMAAGCRVEWFPHLTCPVQGAWAAARRELPVFLFPEMGERGRVYLHVLDSRGLPLGRKGERRVGQALRQGDFRRVRAGQVTEAERLDWSEGQWAAAVARQASLGRPALRRVTAAVPGDSPVDRAIRLALEALGCRVEDKWRKGIPAFFGGHGGFRLTAQDEKGALLDSGQLLALITLIEMENGSGKVAVPAGASAAVELVAAGYGGRVLRLERDGPRARELYAGRPWLWAAPSAAARICARMGVSGQRLETLISKTPRFSAWKREVPLTAHRAHVMDALARSCGRPLRGEGLRLRTGGGWVWLAPLARRSALRVVAEGPDLELAAELCDFYAGQAAEADRALSAQNDRDTEKK